MGRGSDIVRAGAGAFFVGLTFIGTNASAGETCQLDLVGRTYCTAGIASEKLEHVTALQEESQWCWAASISMVFKYHGYNVSQERIVAQTYGAIVNMPAITGTMITKNLNRPWIADDGVTKFESTGAAFDLQAGTLGVSNIDIITELKNDRPMIIGAQGHAMMLTAVTYYPSFVGPEFVGATVRDPWPGNSPPKEKGKRQLTMQELQPMYVAKARVGKAEKDEQEPSAGGGHSSTTNALAKILQSSNNGFDGLKGPNSEMIDGIEVWDTTVSLGSEPCEVYSQDNDGKPYAICSLYKGNDSALANKAFGTGRGLVSDAIDSNWSAKMISDDPKRKLYVAKLNGATRASVNMKASTSGKYTVVLNVIGP